MVIRGEAMKYILIVLTVISFALGQNGMSYGMFGESDTTMIQQISFNGEVVSESRWYFKAKDYEDASYVIQAEPHLQYLNFMAKREYEEKKKCIIRVEWLDIERSNQ